jgi:hypothetical protein
MHLVDVRVVEHGFGGNTTDVQARPAKGPTLLAVWVRTTLILNLNEAMD